MKDASDFGGKRAEMSVGNTLKMVAKGKRERALVEEYIVVRRGF